MLVGVVGPSGAGKDTLLAGARAALADAPTIRFARRVITRPADPAGENHLPATTEEFLRLRDAGGFALWWEAHGLHYGIPAHVAAEVAEGKLVVANLSRSVLAEAAARLPLIVVEVTAPPVLRAARLAARGREAPDDVARRLAREAPLPPGLEVHRVVNDDTPERGIAALARLLGGLASAAANLRLGEVEWP